MDVSINTKTRRIFCIAAVAGVLALGAGCESEENFKETPGGILVDVRDNQSYPTVEINGKRWMASNLNYAGEGGDFGICAHRNNLDAAATEACDKYGRLYTWEEATAWPECTKLACPDDKIECNQCWGGGCPSLWRLPSKADWDELIAFAGGDVAAKGLKATYGWSMYGEAGNGTDDYGFTALAAGKSPEILLFDCPQPECPPCEEYDDGQNQKICPVCPITDCLRPRPDGNFGEAGWWWSSTEIDSSNAHSLSMHSHTDDVAGRDYGKSYAMSVRCVQDI